MPKDFLSHRSQLLTYLRIEVYDRVKERPRGLVKIKIRVNNKKYKVQ